MNKLIVSLGILLSVSFIEKRGFAMGSEAAKDSKEKTSETPQSYVANQVLVSLKNPLKFIERTQLWTEWKLKEVEKIGSGDLYLLEVQTKEKVDIKALCKEIEKNSKVKYAEPNMIQKTFSIGS